LPSGNYWTIPAVVSDEKAGGGAATDAIWKWVDQPRPAPIAAGPSHSKSACDRDKRSRLQKLRHHHRYAFSRVAIAASRREHDPAGSDARPQLHSKAPQSPAA